MNNALTNPRMCNPNSTSTNSVAMTTQINSAASVQAYKAKLAKPRRRSRFCSSTCADWRARSSSRDQFCWKKRPRSMMRLNRLAITPRSAAIPVSKNTGATASCIARAMSGTLSIGFTVGGQLRVGYCLPVAGLEYLQRAPTRGVRLVLRSYGCQGTPPDYLSIKSSFPKSTRANRRKTGPTKPLSGQTHHSIAHCSAWPLLHYQTLRKPDERYEAPQSFNRLNSNRAVVHLESFSACL